MTRLSDIVVPASLIAEVRAGDAKAAAALYEAVAGPAFALARRLVGAQAAEDVFQDSLMNMYRELDQFRGETYFGRWLRRIVVTRSLMHLRSPWRRAQQWLWGEHEAEIAADGAAPLQVDPAAQLDAERLLARLTPTARAVLWLHTVEGYSHEEIAAQFGRSTSFSKTQLARALQRLRASAQPQQESELWDPAKKPSRV